MLIFPSRYLFGLCIPERIGGDVWASGFVSICGFAQRWPVQFGTVPIPAGLGVFVREVSGRFAVPGCCLLKLSCCYLRKEVEEHIPIDFLCYVGSQGI